MLSHSNPVSVTSKSRSESSASSRSTISISHDPSSPNRLSARIYARRCSSLRPSINTHGTELIPSCFAASILPCPAIRLKSESIRHGDRNPNSEMLSFSFSICSGPCIFAFLSYGLSLTIGTSCTLAIFPIELLLFSKNSRITRSVFLEAAHRSPGYRLSTGPGGSSGSSSSRASA